jgi:Legume lectin domain/Chitobiase/beta-hexosaminidase C-terminal domain
MLVINKFKRARYQGENPESILRSDQSKRLFTSLAVFLLAALTTQAQSSVTTQHYDIGRSGANTNETILTPANVNSTTFGKLFSYPVDGLVYAQPLYMPGVTMGTGTTQAGTTHNVLFVATEHDSVYAFDADSNAGANATPLWRVSLIGAGETTVPNSDLSTGDIQPEIGITSTPVIDPTSNTIYVVAKTTVSGTTFIQRLHALDITTGQERFGGPVTLSASVPGTGNGSSGGTLNWDPKWENNRTSLLLLNGIVYIGFGSHGDNGPWHGWILAYNASTLQQTGAWCATPNAAAGGIWMGGTGLAADVPSGKPYGRIFTATGNGTFDATAPTYTNAMDYGDSIIKLDLNNGVPTMNASGTVVGDDFTPSDQATLDNNDTDVASGGVVLIPPDSLVQIGKTGRVYVLNRENLGGYNSNNPNNNPPDPEQAASVGGLWGAPATWNGNVYIWGTGDHLKAFSYANGVLSANPTSTSNESAGTYSPTPTVSANGTTDGIVWSMKTDNYGPPPGTATLYAHDASNVNNLLYSSATNATRDNPGNSIKFVTPTVINGKVYVGTEIPVNGQMEGQVSVFGLLNGATQAATPVISPASESFNPSVQVTITESTAGASIYYTTDGSIPTEASTKYVNPFTLTSTATVNAIAAGTGLLQSPEASATYTLTTQVATPTLTPAPGGYTTVQSVIITTTTPNATIYYTTDGSTPTTSSTKYTGPVSVGVTETLSAIAVASGLSNSPVASGLYTIDLGGVSSINYGSGFTAGTMDLLGSAKLNGTALELTDGGGNEAAAAWYQVPANIQAFTTDFTFQITPASTSTADGFTFTMQGNNASSIGPSGGGLGYGPDSTTGTPGIGSSVAVKFDLYNNAGEGVDSTGLYTNGASPTVPAIDMTSSGVNLHSGDPFHAHFTYDGTTLSMTLTDTTTNASFSTSWTVNIPSIVGGNVAYVGFTGGTGGQTATQEILTWTLVSTGGQTTAATPTFSPNGGTFSASTPVTISDTTTGATISYCFDTTNTCTPSTSGSSYTVTSTGYLRAQATASGYAASPVASATFTITSGSTIINYASGFSATGLALNGSAALSGTRLRLTNGAENQAGSGWYTTPVNVQTFTSDFTFQLATPNADGIAFVIQNTGITAVGPSGGGLGYGPDNVTSPSSSTNTPIAKSVAVKFDLYNNAGEGVNSTGLYTDGASPTIPAVTLAGGVNLHSGDTFHVHMVYDGTTLAMTITDTVTPTETFAYEWEINIPSTVGGNTAYVGFTGGTGGSTATQDIVTWSYSNSSVALQKPIVYQTATLPAVSSGPTFRTFTYAGFPDTTGTILDATAVGENVTFTVNVGVAGTYEIILGYKDHNTRGISQLSINGTNVGSPLDQYAASDSYATVDFGTFTFPTAGNYSFKFTVTGKDTSSSGYSISFDDITLMP